MKKYLLMSIRPEYASKIVEKNKTIELRRILPRVSRGDTLVIYESSPVKKITAYCHIDALVADELGAFWEKYGKQSCIEKEEFLDYFSGKDYAGGILLGEVAELKKKKDLAEVMDKPHAPQSYCYLSEAEYNRVK